MKEIDFLINHIPDTLYQTDLEGCIVFISPSAEKLLGYTSKELLGMVLADLYADKSQRQEFLQQLDENDGQISGYQAPLRHKNGGIVWVATSATYYYEKDGKIAGVEGIARDITMQHQAQEEIKRSRDELEKLVKKRTVELEKEIDEHKKTEKVLQKNSDLLAKSQEIAHIGSWQLDLTTDLLFWSDEVYRIFGLKPQEFEATYAGFLEAIHPEDRTKVDDAYSNSLRDEKDSYEIEHRIVHKNTGEVRYVHEKCVHFKDTTGSVVESVGMVQDITERKSAEQALRIEKDNLENVFESMKDGVYIVSQQYDIQYVNPVLIKEFGAYETLKCYQYLHNRTEACPWCKAMDVFAGKTVRWEWHSPKNQKDYDLIDSPLINLDGSISKLEIFRDITEQKKQEAQKLKLKQQQEELKRLESLKIMAGAVAHRFNNSMQSVLGYLELLDMTIADGSPGSGDVSNALQVAQEASQVGSMMLTYLGQRANQCRLEDLVGLTRNTVTELKNQLPPSISLKFTTPSEPLYCSMDSSQIKEVISSVFINAIESLEGAIGTIKITFGSDSYNTDSFPIPFRSDNLEDGIYSFCQISDSGKGINEEDLKMVFDPFFTTKFVGRGLGLALTVGIMRNHHGALMIESTPDQGTKVWILLSAMNQ